MAHDDGGARIGGATGGRRGLKPSGIAYESPEDLVRFWRETTEEALDAPLDITRAFLPDFDAEGFAVWSFRFRGIDGETRHGWQARPERIGERVTPAFLWLPPYGRESRLPDGYGTRAGYTSWSLNFHGESAYHQERYRQERGYFGQGVEDPYSFVFRRMYQDAVIVLRLMGQTRGLDPTALGVMGMSQGGGIALWIAAFSGLVRTCVSDMPFLGDPVGVLDAPIMRYPQRELRDAAERITFGREVALNTLSYFDTRHAAAYVHVPTLVSLGEKDPSCKPVSVEGVYEAISGPKRLVRYPGGHDWDADMIGNNAAWLDRHLPVTHQP